MATESPEPPKKRLKTEGGSEDGASPTPAEDNKQETVDKADREVESEARLPAVEESEAVQKYENRRALDPVTGTYTSSIYVDAFNLALDTVLKDEAYLFSEGELEIFAKYRSLPYEAQHL